MKDFKANRLQITHESLQQPSYAFALMNLLTLAICYAKIEDDLYVSWGTVFAPSMIYFFAKVLRLVVAIAVE